MRIFRKFARFSLLFFDFSEKPEKIEKNGEKKESIYR